MNGKIIVAPDPILRQVSKPVKKITPVVEKIADEIVNFMDEHSKDNNKPIGLTACELGYSIRMIAFRMNPQSSDRDDIIILINPELVYAKGQHIVKEGCLSLPGKVYQLKRHKLVKIRGRILDGTSRSFRGRDLLAQVFQHELNHLDGITIDSIGKKVAN